MMAKLFGFLKDLLWRPPGGLRRHWRQVGGFVVTLAGAAFFLQFVDRFYPLKEWLFFRYASYWAICLGFAVACLASGQVVVSFVCGRRLPLREHFVLSFAAGVLAFVLGWFVLGVLGLFNPWTAIGWPLVLIGVGARPTFRLLREVRGKLRAAPRGRTRRGFLYFAALTIGIVGALLVYFPLLTPVNLAFDSRYYHMAIAEHYAMDGGIRMFPEGWFMGTYPQLASQLYSWAFTLPFATFFDRGELSVHLEFVLFIYTLASLPSLIRRLAPGAPVPLLWVSLFLFPELYCYDSLLSGAADHVAAIWCIPIFLALLRLFEDFTWRRGVLFGIMVSGPMLTKYSVWSMVIVPCLAVAVYGVVLAVKRLRGRTEIGLRGLTTPLIVAGVVLAVTAPHWLKNLVWYHDPFYPLLHAYFPSQPWTIDNEIRLHRFLPAEWMAERSWKGVRESLFAALDFSFVPRDWPNFHRDVPIFGSLFTLSVPCLLFVRQKKRLFLLYLAAHLSVIQWFWSFHQDRYLQSFVPWMAAGIAAVGLQLWRLGWAPRIGVAVLGMTQFVWGLDVPFFLTNAMTGSQHKATIDFLGQGHKQNYKARLRPYGSWHDMADAMPRGSRVLLHDELVRLGLGAPVISDSGPWQGAINYGRSPAPEQIDSMYRKFGVTHLIWPNAGSRAVDSWAGDIAFFNYAFRYGQDPKTYDGYTLVRMPETPPLRGQFRNLALVLGCGEEYKNGIYEITDLVVQPFQLPGRPQKIPKPRRRVRAEDSIAEELRDVDAVVTNSRCYKGERNLASAGFVEAIRRPPNKIWVRREQGPRGTAISAN